MFQTVKSDYRIFIGIKDDKINEIDWKEMSVKLRKITANPEERIIGYLKAAIKMLQKQ